LGSFTTAAAKLLYGESSEALKAGRVATVQSLSGTGSLRLIAEFVHRFLPKAKVYNSSPTWGNHKAILKDAGIAEGEYRYWNGKTRGLDFEGMLADLEKAPNGSVILLHACAHNPTGVDPTKDQWRKIASVMKQKEHLPWFDSAYQGFATGDIEGDAWAIRYFVEQDFEMCTSQSFAKNFGLYCERAGTSGVVCADKAKAENVLSQLQVLIRPMYSNPPKHGALIVSTVLNDKALFAEWRDELKGMAHQIIKCRKLLFEELKRLGTPGDWTNIISQIGMFSYTGLSVAQCDVLVKKHHIYLLSNGRASMCGVNTHNVAYVARAIDDVVRNN